MIWSDDGGGKEKMRSSGGRSFQRRGAVTDMTDINGAVDASIFKTF